MAMYTMWVVHEGFGKLIESFSAWRQSILSRCSCSVEKTESFDEKKTV